jgi:hypothetical protein
MQLLTGEVEVVDWRHSRHLKLVGAVLTEVMQQL